MLAKSSLGHFRPWRDGVIPKGLLEVLAAFLTAPDLGIANGHGLGPNLDSYFDALDLMTLDLLIIRYGTLSLVISNGSGDLMSVYPMRKWNDFGPNALNKVSSSSCDYFVCKTISQARSWPRAVLFNTIMKYFDSQPPSCHILENMLAKDHPKLTTS